MSERPSDRTYPVQYLPAIPLAPDGWPDECVWDRAHVENRFVFPWKQAAAPLTEFRAVCDDAFFYFSFRVQDDDVVVLDTLSDKQDVVLEDRVEIFFSRDDQMSEYYAVEIDPLGRTYDYSGKYYRQFDPSWNWRGLKTKGELRERGYIVQGRAPLSSFTALGFPPLRPGVKIRCGLYRAEFSHDLGGEPAMQRESIHNRGRGDGPPPIEQWMAWIDPRTETPDFHVPASLGWLEIQP